MPRSGPRAVCRYRDEFKLTRLFAQHKQRYESLDYSR
jgi:hypothetical protein